MECLGVSVSLTSGYQSESNGQVERVNQEVGRFLRFYCRDQPGEWSRYIPWADLAQNSLLHEHVTISMRFGLPAGPGTVASESDRGFCGGGVGAALQGELEGRPEIPQAGRWTAEEER
jgi:hypothetical protein